MVRFLYFLILALLARLLWKSVASWIASQTPGRVGASASGERRGTLYKGHMVRDPVCGLHIPEDRAITVTLGGERQHFCSERCRDRYRAAS